ncbi:MAG: hypothetical protein FWD16_08000 [Clostridia bacterium]|nr:hypothetical protein [Clostridia bacterium]
MKRTLAITLLAALMAALAACAALVAPFSLSDFAFYTGNSPEKVLQETEDQNYQSLSEYSWYKASRGVAIGDDGLAAIAKYPFKGWALLGYGDPDPANFMEPLEYEIYTGALDIAGLVEKCKKNGHFLQLSVYLTAATRPIDMTERLALAQAINNGTASADEAENALIKEDYYMFQLEIKDGLVSSVNLAFNKYVEYQYDPFEVPLEQMEPIEP